MQVIGPWRKPLPGQDNTNTEISADILCRFLDRHPRVGAIAQTTRPPPSPHLIIERMDLRVAETVYTYQNFMVWVRERTIPTERPPLVGEVIANFCG
jgi:hypothetical protein